MANTHRHVYGENNPKKVPAVASVAIEIGDVVYLDGASVKPASSLADLGMLVTNQEAIHDGFVGVAMQARLTSQAAEGLITVGTTGVWEFDLRTALVAQKEVGVLFGIDEAASGTVVLAQGVIEVATENLAIGRLAERALNGATKVRLEIISTKVLGGPQAMA